MNKTDKIQKENIASKISPENQSNTSPPNKDMNSNTNPTNNIPPKEGHNVINKIYKPNELKQLDTVVHFRENIIHYDKNCNDPVTQYSYYCFTCKQSVCYKCGINNHKEHILIQRDNCLNYDKTFFDQISKVIEDSLSIEDKKNDIKNAITNSINTFKVTLDNLRSIKFKEIDIIFNKLKNNLLEMKNNYLKTKKIIEDYYSKNQSFFNIYFEKLNKSIDINNIINDDTTLNNLNDNKVENNDNNNNNNNKNEFCFKNKDIENTIFILNFDLMNLCDNKNLEIVDLINNIKNKINVYLEEINNKTKIVQNELMHYLDIPLDINKFTDFYKEVNSRIERYSEHISQFKETIYEIIKKTSNLDKIKDLINILESKNKKGKNQVFEQEFFKNPNENKNNEIIKVRQNSKSKKLSRGTSSDFKIIGRNNNKSTIKIDENNNISYNNLKINLMKKESSQNKKSSVSPFKTMGNNKLLKTKKIKNLMIKANSYFDPGNKSISKASLNAKEIILNQRILQKFFAYSIYGFYSRFYNNTSIKENNIKLSTKKNGNSSISPEETNHCKNDGEVVIRTVSYLANYTQRYNKLKEKAKPIIGTNQIHLYDLSTKKITKKTVNLSKEEHGYILFPEGCRHILIDNNLYITGGSDMCGMPINIVLLYNIQTNTIKKINNLLENHSYHTMEYLENYDSVILIGGENSNDCEIMDVDTKKWYKLPELNYPRANVNIYYNSITSDLFALFGISGDISDKKIKYSDIIEVLEMNNISNGWARVDYYKRSGLNLKYNYCMTLPFNKDMLLIYGAENMRSVNKNLFALFDMHKNECIKVDKNTLEQIKIEEKKTKLVDMALNKMNFDK